MTAKELRTKARSMNADHLAHAIGYDATEVRRWINGGVNASVEMAVRSYFGKG